MTAPHVPRAETFRILEDHSCAFLVFFPYALVPLGPTQLNPLFLSLSCHTSWFYLRQGSLPAPCPILFFLDLFPIHLVLQHTLIRFSSLPSFLTFFKWGCTPAVLSSSLSTLMAQKISIGPPLGHPPPD